MVVESSRHPLPLMNTVFGRMKANQEPGEEFRPGFQHAADAWCKRFSTWLQVDEL
jgi:hypothetical protein